MRRQKKQANLPAFAREALGRGELAPSMVEEAKRTAADDLYEDPYDEAPAAEMPAEMAERFRQDLEAIPRMAELRKRATADPREGVAQRRMTPEVRVQHYEDVIARLSILDEDSTTLVKDARERTLLASNSVYTDIETEFATRPDDEGMTVEQFEQAFYTLRRRREGRDGQLAYYWGERDRELVVCLRLSDDRKTIVRYYYLPGV